jgi:purine-binding chemotaxis protein CheW
VVAVRGIQIGIVVDRVSEVLTIPADEVAPPPSFGADVDTGYLLGLAKADGRVRLLLDIDRVLSTSDVLALRATDA